MKHFTLRYSIQSQDPIEPRLPDCRYAVIDHHTGDTVERWLTWDEAHDLINELLDENPAPAFDEFPAHERAASAGDMAYQLAKEQF